MKLIGIAVLMVADICAAQGCVKINQHKPPAQKGIPGTTMTLTDSVDENSYWQSRKGGPWKHHGKFYTRWSYDAYVIFPDERSCKAYAKNPVPLYGAQQDMRVLGTIQ